MEIRSPSSFALLAVLFLLSLAALGGYLCVAILLWSRVSRNARWALGMHVVFFACAVSGVAIMLLLSGVFDASALRSDRAPGPDGQFYLYDYTGRPEYIEVSESTFRALYVCESSMPLIWGVAMTAGAWLLWRNGGQFLPAEVRERLADLERGK